MELLFEHGEEGAKGWFQLSNEGKVVARMTFSRVDPHYVIIDHTAVDPNEKGHGYGKAIVERMVDWARETDHKIMPLCPFTKRIISANLNLQDVIKK